MQDSSHCALCSAKDCLSTLGHYTLCASCRLMLFRAAMEFAEQNTVRGTVYHTAFAELRTRLEHEPEKFI